VFKTGIQRAFKGARKMMSLFNEACKTSLQTTSSFHDKPVKPSQLIAVKSRSSELSNALLRLIAQYSQVELTVKPTIEPTVKTTVNIH
jgi:hypothetical protein